MRLVTTAIASLLALSLMPASGWCADHPVAARKLLIKSKNGREKLVLTVRDASVGFPAVGGVDDPVGIGMTVELIAGSGETGSLLLPAGAAWAAKSGRYRFDNNSAPAGISAVRKLKLVEGRLLKIVSRAAGVQPTGSLSVMGLRVSTGSVRSCLLFEAATVVKEDSTKFLAKNSDAAALVDCSDETLGILCAFDPNGLTCTGACSGAGVCALTDPFSATCSCLDPSDPCDGTAPVCNGTCPAGEFCAAYGSGISAGCGCLPDGASVCGGVPGVCGGDCPSGLGCVTVFDLPVLGGGAFCTCGASGECGGTGASCPPGFGCGIIPGSTPFCVPVDCPGSTVFPTCGGNCGAGAICTAVDLLGFQTCICSPASTACDASCSGYECAPGQACFLDNAGCVCGVP